MAVDDSIEIRRLRASVARLADLTSGRPRTGTTHDGADDTVGTVASDDAIDFDPIPLLRALHDCGATVVVIGQVAGIMHGSSELTGDLDMLWDGDLSQAPAITAAFERVGGAFTDDDCQPLALAPASLALTKVQFHSPTASGDLCTPALPWGAIPVAEFLPRARIAGGADGLRIRYLDLGDLIAMRRAVGRPKDLRRAEELSRLC